MRALKYSAFSEVVYILGKYPEGDGIYVHLDITAMANIQSMALFLLPIPS